MGLERKTGVPTFVEQVEALYRRHEHHILPFVGRAFSIPSRTDLRVLTIGINAYISPKDWHPERNQPHPEWLRGWFANGRHRFDRRVLKDATELARQLVPVVPAFAGLGFAGRDSIFHTNAIKVYVPEAKGKHAHQLEDADFERHVPQWHDELRMMSDAGVLPHLVLVFGGPFWRYAWPAFHPAHQASRAGLEVTGYQAGAGEAAHWATRVTIAKQGAQHELLLVRLRHPSGRTPKGSPRWLMDNTDFRTLLRERVKD